MKLIIVVIAILFIAAETNNPRSKIFYLTDNSAQTALPGLAELKNNPYKLPLELLNWYEFTNVVRKT